MGILTPEQKKLIDDMDVKDRVELVRTILWNDIDILKEGYPLVPSTDDVEYESFLKGALAMFDYAQMRAANHFHPHYQKQCDIENDFLLDTMEDALMDISPSKVMEWHSICRLHARINELNDIINKSSKEGLLDKLIKKIRREDG